MAHEAMHEAEQKLSSWTLDVHRAIASMMEELEAVDWYQQRVDATEDAELKEILAHNRDEEKEHFAMVLEWLRRRDSTLSEHLKTYLFTEKDILALEEESEQEGEDESVEYHIPSVGSLKEESSHEISRS